MSGTTAHEPVPSDYAERVRRLRGRLGLTQVRLADLLGVSFATVNRWENGQSRPSALAWRLIGEMEDRGTRALGVHPAGRQGGAGGPGGFPSPAEVARDGQSWLPPYGSGTGTSSQTASGTPSEPGHSYPTIDFTGSPNAAWVIAEAERLSYGHLFNPAFAAEASLIDPLPHQRIAVYERMLPQQRLRFLLADDAGAGKTIMTGLYIREMLSRRLIRRVLVVPPAGLLGNWRRELLRWFGLRFTIVSGSASISGNPFVGPDSDLLIVSVDTLAGDRMFGRLAEPGVAPYDLVVFDEAHKLAADRQPDHTVRRTERYRLAEALAGASPGFSEESPPGGDGWGKERSADSSLPPVKPTRRDADRWRLGWHCTHLLLLSATPHMGKDFPYYCLWRLLEPQALPTMEAFTQYPAEARRMRFIRRTKEEMVDLEGRPIYPTRVSNTLSYDLTQGEVSEQSLYDQMTEYIRTHYDLARLLNRSAARLAMSVFQRRLASSTYALMRSLERRLNRLDQMVEDMRTGRLTPEGLEATQARLTGWPDYLDSGTAEEEEASDGTEENEDVERVLLGGVTATRLQDLETERDHVAELLRLARRVAESGHESKFDKLREVIEDRRFSNEKLIVFTEHRDTLDFLVRRLEAQGYGGRIAQIHGAMPFQEREQQVERFRRPVSEGGAAYLIGTDAAGEGINLQFCWLMVNYDIPWNPARLEQRMGRVHRYGQAHDPVVIINLVAGKTREGRVVKTLLDKLERIRQELGSDKVYDVVGRLLEGVSLREYMEMVLTREEPPPGDQLRHPDHGDAGYRAAREVERVLEGKLTASRVKDIQAEDRCLFGSGGDVGRQLPELRSRLDHERLRRLLPGYVRRFIERACPLVGLRIEGDPDGIFWLRPSSLPVRDALWPGISQYPDGWDTAFRVYEPRSETVSAGVANAPDARHVAQLYPGEPLFEALRSYVQGRFASEALRGAVFVDPTASRPYLFHLAVVEVVRNEDGGGTVRSAASGMPAAQVRPKVLVSRLVGLRQDTDGAVREFPVEHLLLLRGWPADWPHASALVSHAASLTAEAASLVETAQRFLTQHVAAAEVEKQRQAAAEDAALRRGLIARGFGHRERALAEERTRLNSRVREGDPSAKARLSLIRLEQQELGAKRTEALDLLDHEHELIGLGDVRFLAHAMIVPSNDPEERKRHDQEVEAMAVRVARAYEEGTGASVQDVSTPQLALAAGLGERPGFDLLSRLPDGTTRAIEVKGRAATGEVDVTENEWAKACNLRGDYWLYVVFDCASPDPRLHRIQDPFLKLLVRARGGVVIEQSEILAHAEA